MPQLILDLDEVCQIIDRELRTNTVCLGIDQAELHTGFCLIRTTQDKFFVEEFYGVELKSKPKQYMHKQLLEYQEKVVDILKDLSKYEDYKKRVIIEDCWMGFNPWTTKVLAKFAAISFLTFNKWADDIPIPIMPTSVRAKVGFKKNKNSKIKLKEQIQDWIIENFDLEIEDDNLSDAFILALAGLIS